MTPAEISARRQQSRSLFDAVHGEPAVQGESAPARQGQGHALLDAGRPQGASTARPACGASMPATAARRSRRRSPQQLDEMDYAPSFQMGHPKAFELAARLAAMLPGDLDHVFFSNSGSEAVDTRAEDRARLSPRQRPGHAHPLHRPRARLSRRRLRRHLGRRHGQQPQVVRRACCPASITCRTPICRRTPSPRASPSTARDLADELERIVGLHDAVEHRRGDRRARAPARPASCRRPRAISSGCARSATSTASC